MSMRRAAAATALAVTSVIFGLVVYVLLSDVPRDVVVSDADVAAAVERER